MRTVVMGTVAVWQPHPNPDTAICILASKAYASPAYVAMPTVPGPEHLPTSSCASDAMLLVPLIALWVVTSYCEKACSQSPFCPHLQLRQHIFRCNSIPSLQWQQVAKDDLGGVCNL